MENIIFNIDLDEEILSHLPNPDSWAVIRSEGFRRELIEDADIRNIFDWQDNHVKEYKQPATASVLADKFDIDFVEPQTAIGELLEKLRERYAKNHARQLLEKGAEVYKINPLGTADYLSKESRILKNLLERRGELFTESDVDLAIELYEKKVARSKEGSLGFDELDEYFGEQQGITFYVAPPKSYKSWMMLKGHIKNAEKGIKSRLYSLELPAEEDDARLRCMMADVPWWKYLKNQMTRGELQRWKEASEKIADLGTYEIVKPPPGERDIESLVETGRDAGAGVIFIDQLQYVEEHRGRSLGELNDPGEYWGVLYKARDLSDDGPICFAHQFNRSTLNAEEMPDIKQAKGSSAIEETSTLALGLWANKDMRRSHILELGTLISRNYLFESWEVNVNLSTECSFKIAGIMNRDEEA